MLDYLIVGLGLAGVSFCECLESKGKTFRVINDNSQTSSIVAAGLYNPVILKRFTLAWNAEKQINLVHPFYAALEKKLGVTLDHKLPLLRRFSSAEEQNNWFRAADTARLQNFLSDEVTANNYAKLDAPFGFGEVIGTGRIATGELIKHYSEYLNANGRILQETFIGTRLKIEKNCVIYNSLKAKRIIFAEGFGLSKNSLFDYLPLTGTKGELLKIKAPNLKVDKIIKSAIFLIPLGRDFYRVGATYKWKDKTNIPTAEAKSELLEKLRAFVKADFTVEEHVAGIRPTVTDRRPLVGRHPIYSNLYVLNGMGSRGVMIAPYASRQLFNLIEYDKPLDPELNIARFSAKYNPK